MDEETLEQAVSMMRPLLEWVVEGEVPAVRAWAIMHHLDQDAYPQIVAADRAKVSPATMCRTVVQFEKRFGLSVRDRRVKFKSRKSAKLSAARWIP